MTVQSFGHEVKGSVSFYHCGKVFLFAYVLKLLDINRTSISSESLFHPHNSLVLSDACAGAYNFAAVVHGGKSTHPSNEHCIVTFQGKLAAVEEKEKWFLFIARYLILMTEWSLQNKINKFNGGQEQASGDRNTPSLNVRVSGSKSVYHHYICYYDHPCLENVTATGTATTS